MANSSLFTSQIMFILAGTLHGGGLVALLFFLVRGLVRKIRGQPQGRWGRHILLSGTVFLVGVGAQAGLIYGSLPKLPDPAYRPGTLTSLGQPAPDFEVTTLEGRQVKLSDLQGKVVVLNFFAPWCGPCQRELPRLEQEVWQVFQDQRFFLLGIGREETSAKLQAFRQKHRFTFPLAADPDGSVYAQYATERIPRTYVISPKGVIVYQCTGYYEVEMAKMTRVIRQQLHQAP